VPLATSTLSWLALLAAVAALVALLVAAAAYRRTARSRRPPRARQRRAVSRNRTRQALSGDQVATELEALQADLSTTLRHLAVVRYDAFGDMGGHLSWSLALLDDGGDGVVLTSIHGRSDSRTYAKNVSAWTASQQLSPEEQEAIRFARGGG
jgi:uncharacterized protein DUF4446